MAIEIKLPELGENIASADVTSVNVKAGDTVEKEQVIVEIETDKAVIEVPVEMSGTIVEVFVKEGDNISIGQLLVSLEPGDAVISSEEAETPKETKETVPEVKKELPIHKTVSHTPLSEPQDVELKIPELGEGIDAADITAVFVKVGDEVQIDQALLELETDKANMELPSEISGTVKKILVKEGEKQKLVKCLSSSKQLTQNRYRCQIQRL